MYGADIGHDAPRHCLFFLLFATYPAASRICIKSFACKFLGSDGHWVRDDMSYPCPTPTSDPFTFFWACASTLCIPIGVPCYCMHKMYQYHLPHLASMKNEVEVVSGFLVKMQKLNKKLGTHPTRCPTLTLCAAQD